MGLQPNIQQQSPFTMKQCTKCAQAKPLAAFAYSNSVFFKDHLLPFCNECADAFIDDGAWDKVDKLCQMSDIPFVPKEWQKIYDSNPENAFARYSIIFKNQEYEGLGWKDYFNEFQELRASNKIARELPELDKQALAEQQARWGKNYDQEALDYLDQLFNGLLSSQNVNGALQVDQALKICKLSYEIDSRIREGSDFDKVLASYDKLVHTAEFTPKNVKNLNDFDSVGELVRWFEKRNWKAKFYDNVTRDIVDETIANIQANNQRLYVNESGIGEDINHRIEMLKSVQTAPATKNEEYFISEDQSYDLDNYSNDEYEELIKKEEFNPDFGGD